MALDGATALVGAPFDPVGDHLDQGAAYVFMRDGGGWSQAQRLFAAEGAADDNLGWSVALSGDTALAGAPFTTLDGHTYQGAAYTFVRSAGSWSQDQQLFDPAGAADDNLGWSVALDGNTALAGAPFAGDQDHAKQGAAHVFVRGDGGWSRQQLAVPDAAADDQFGNAVALDTDTALVGAPYRDVDGDANRGTGYFFTPGSLDQSISFAPLPDRVLGEPSFPITATATSGLPVSFTALTPAVCTVQAGTVELHSAGVCTIRADQSGDASYHPAPPVEQSFTVAAPEPEPEPEPDSTPALFLPALTR